MDVSCGTGDFSFAVAVCVVVGAVTVGFFGLHRFAPSLARSAPKELGPLTKRATIVPLFLSWAATNGNNNNTK